jgi:hypothetical protein
VGKREACPYGIIGVGWGALPLAAPRANTQVRPYRIRVVEPTDLSGSTEFFRTGHPRRSPCFPSFYTPVRLIVNQDLVLYIGFSLSNVRNGLFHEKQPL